MQGITGGIESAIKGDRRFQEVLLQFLIGDLIENSAVFEIMKKGLFHAAILTELKADIKLS